MPGPPSPESARPSRPQRLAWLAVASLLAGLALALVLVGDFEYWVWLAAAGGMLAGLATAALVWWWSPLERVPAWVAAGLLLAVGVRLVLIGGARHELSDDIYRYRWDGKVLSHGINPYLYPPSHPVLDGLRDHPLDRRVNHPDVHTVYPPLAEIVFCLGYLLQPGGLQGLQSLFLLSEFVAWLLLLRLLRRRGRPAVLALLAAWLPLGFIEGYLPGHVDVLALPWLSGFLLLLERRRALPAAACLAAAVLLRPLYLLLVPAAAFHLGWRKSLAAAAVFIALVAGAYLPFAAAGFRLASSTVLMARFWTFNESGFTLLAGLLPAQPARAAAALLVLATTLALAWWQRRRPWLAMSGALIAFALFSPAVFPWYLLGGLLLAASECEPALLWLLAALPLAELVMIDYRLSGRWHLSGWARALEFVPLLVVLAFQALTRRGPFSPARPPGP